MKSKRDSSRIVACTLAVLLGSVVLAQPVPGEPTAGETPAEVATRLASIAGTVTSDGGDRALKRASVSLRRIVDSSTGTIYEDVTTTATDDEGRFDFDELPPGDYRLSAERRGFLRYEFGQRRHNAPGTILSLDEGQRLEGLELELATMGAIAGRIFDEDGEPVTGVEVRALGYVYKNGERRLAPAGEGGLTDDLGEYRIYWLEPGEYHLLATPGPGFAGSVTPFEEGESRPGARGSYAPTFFPGTVSAERARPAVLAAGADKRGFDFTIRALPTVTVSGQLVVPAAMTSAVPLPARKHEGRGRDARRKERRSRDGNGSRIVVSLTRESKVGEAVASSGGGRASVGYDGYFKISDVVPGSYLLVAQARQAGRRAAARMRLVVGSSGVENLVVPLLTGIDVQGEVVTESAPPDRFEATKLRVALEPTIAVRGGGGRVAPAQVDEAGAFTLTDVAPGEYRLRVVGLPDGVHVTSGSFGGADALNRPFVIEAGRPSPLRLELAFDSGQVAGDVLGEGDEPVPGALVSLAPAGARSQRLDLHRAARTQRDGRYSFDRVPPGKYALFAWESLPEGAHLSPAYLESFAKRGRPVTVEADGSADVRLSLIRRGT